MSLYLRKCPKEGKNRLKHQDHSQMSAMSTNVQKNIELEHLSSKLILQIHDELLFEFPVEEKDVLIPLVKKSMENAMKLKVPIIVDYGSGKDWFEAH